MEKGPCTKFCDVLISFQEVVRLKSFKLDTNDVIQTNVEKHFTPALFLFPRFFVNFMKKEPTTRFDDGAFNYFFTIS